MGQRFNEAGAVKIKQTHRPSRSRDVLSLVVRNTEYDNEEMKEALPEPIVFDSLVREINQKPRVTRFQIKW